MTKNNQKKIPFKTKRTKKYIFYILIILTVFFSLLTRGAINSITLTEAAPTVLSNGLGYFLAGKAYPFTINVKDPLATGWGDINEVRLTIPSGTPAGASDIVVRAHTFVAGPSATGTVLSGNVSFSGGTPAVAGTFDDFTVTFTLLFQWNTPETAWHATSVLTASATTSNTLTDTKNISYGVVSSIIILNPAMDGEAADGMVNRLHGAFNATGGEIVYNIPGAAAADAVRTNADAGAGEINAATTLRVNPGNYNAGSDDGNEGNGFSASPSMVGLANSTVAYSVLVQAPMATAGGPVDTQNSLSLLVNEVEVLSVVFVNGGGIDSPPFTEYYRSTLIAGTQITVTAELLAGVGAMVGNTTVNIRDSENNDTFVVIPNGQKTATVNLTYPSVFVNPTENKTYYAYNVSGGAFGSVPGAGQNNNNRTLITQPGAGPPTDPNIYWDNGDPPGINTGDFTSYSGGDTSTSQSFTVNWNAVTAGGPEFDEDFYTYRIYFKKDTAPAWLMLDRNTGAAFASLGIIGTTSVTVTGLLPFTNYQYRLSAVDVFGNEVDCTPCGPFPNFGNQPEGVIATQPTSISLSVSDGVTQYENAGFDIDPDPVTVHPLRETAIRIRAVIVTSGNVPDEVNIIAADNSTDGATDYIMNLPPAQRYSIACVNTLPETWIGYIPTTNPLISSGTSVRMILEVKFGAGTTYVDHDSEIDPPPGDPTNLEWRFHIGTATTFTPWPVRVLNNVITSSNPKAYPSYYLTDDAFVTIRVYDIKGRSVVNLLENASRKGGQNIREQGWNGYNKARKKLGVGLYYIHIKAERISDRKTILNEFRKVVIRR